MPLVSLRRGRRLFLCFGAIFMVKKFFSKFFSKIGCVLAPQFQISEGVDSRTRISSFVATWKLNRQALRTLVLMNSPKVGTPWLFLLRYMENERESPTWNSACYWNGNDSQNDNDTSLRSWRSTRQRWDSYDTVSQTVTLVLPVQSESLSAGGVENKYCGLYI